MTEFPSPYGLPSDYLPQKPPMQVLDRILSITEDAVSCGCDPGPAGPLGAFRNERGALPAEVAVELLAQTVGVWAGFCRRARNKAAPAGEKDAPAGFLLSVRGMKVCAQGIPSEGLLTITMEKLVYEDSMGSFEGRIEAGGRVIATGRVSVFQPKARELARIQALRA